MAETTTPTALELARELSTKQAELTKFEKELKYFQGRVVARTAEVAAAKKRVAELETALSAPAAKK